jgi:hypothetical protein
MQDFAALPETRGARRRHHRESANLPVPTGLVVTDR